MVAIIRRSLKAEQPPLTKFRRWRLMRALDRSGTGRTLSLDQAKAQFRKLEALRWLKLPKAD